MRSTARSRSRTLVWIIVPALLLTLPAVVLVRHEAQELRYEELAESIRGPFWLEHREVYDGASTNVGWYAFLILIYRVFGFGLTTAKWARVALLAASLIALSALLHRHLRRWPAVAALAAFAASPTLLFLNRLTTSYGTDLLMLPFCLLLLDELWRRARAPDAAGAAATAGALGAVAMVGAMVYPALVPALPFLAAWSFAALPTGARFRPATAGIVGFLLPLSIATLMMRDRRSLFWDPIEHAGIFRGGASGWVGDWSRLRDNLSGLAADLFRDGSSYYFELNAVEFGDGLGRAGFAAVVLLAIAAAWKVRETRPILATALGAALLAALLTGAAGGPPGLRRATVALAAFYLVVATLWAVSTRLATGPWSRAAIAAALLLLPLHHALAYDDQLEQAAQPVWGRERVWFAVAPTVDATPQLSFQHWLSHTAAGRPLDCGVLRTPGTQECRYDYIYAAIAGWRRWNRKPPIDVLAVDPRNGETVVLTPSEWRSRAFPAVRNRPPRVQKRPSIPGS